LRKKKVSALFLIGELKRDEVMDFIDNKRYNGAMKTLRSRERRFRNK